MKNHNEVSKNTDVKNTSKIKRHTKQIAESVKYPVIESIFGKIENVYCHIRLDLN